MSAMNLFALAFSSLLSIHGLRRRSLSLSGALIGFVVGYIFLSSPLHAFPVALFVFYILGSRATRIGAQRKSQLEDGHHPSSGTGTDNADGGSRTGWQVLCNSLPALSASLLWSAHFVPSSLPSFILLNHLHILPACFALDPDSLTVVGVAYDPTEWCPVSPTISEGLSRALVLAVLGHFACCLGDTLASELGILSSSPPILLTTFRRVPPGTNGAISLGGTIASIAGGTLVGCAMAASLILESQACRRSALTVTGPLLAWGAVAGGVGSLIDSFLGATIQRTRYSVSSKRVLQDHSPASDDVKIISGLNILTNNQVNLVSSTITAILLANLG